jgi:hypothetical protein
MAPEHFEMNTGPLDQKASALVGSPQLSAQGGVACESVDGILLTEPRIEAIRRELQALIQVVDLEAGGEVVGVDGFRLREIANWTDYPTSLSEIFWHLSSACNFDCEFCYEKGNPPDFPIQNIPRMTSLQEIVTRLRNYDPRTGKGIFAVRTAINEPFANRNALRCLQLMRTAAPHELISFVTNGAYLDEATVTAVAELHPVFLNLSIYSTDPEVRRKTIRDFRGDHSVRAADLLCRYEVPYMANLVMWPSIPFADMQRTVAFMAERLATMIRICLGGYSRYLPGEFIRFQAEEYWPAVVEEVERIQDKHRIPVLIEPSCYVRRDTEAYVDGVLRDSPAERAGIRRGDLITRVNGAPIQSRMQLNAVLARAAGPEGVHFWSPQELVRDEDMPGKRTDAIAIDFSRGQSRHSVKLRRYDPEAMKTYPYCRVAHFHDFAFGLVLTQTLRYSSLLKAREIILKRNARRVLLISSQMIRPVLGYMLSRSNAFSGMDVDIRVAGNRFFGGTINVGDLLVAQDFIDEIRDYEVEHGKLDLVLIPASPFASSPWGRDLAGHPWTEIERRTGVPVELVPCQSINL